jgi:N-acetylglucosamine-6-sulfatase
MPRARSAFRALAIAVTSLSLGVSLSTCTHPTQPGPPSIVLVLTDDQRFDTLAAMPSVQKDLVDHGVTFTNGFVSDSLCCPSRASILTGQYASQTGVWGNKEPFGGWHAFHDRSTVATRLRAKGYHTALFGKYLNGYHDTTYIPPGWEHWAAFDGSASAYNLYYKYTLNENGRLVRYGNKVDDYSTDVLASMATDYIRSTAGPLFVYFAPYGPHTPTSPDAQDANAPVTLPFPRRPDYDESDVSDKPEWLRRRPPLRPDQVAYTRTEWTKEIRTDLSLDRAVDGIVQALDDSGRLQNTLIVFMSDNGFLLGEHRFINKVAPYEESIRVPFVVRYDPLIGRPRTDPHLVVNIDLAPTFAAVARTTAPGAAGLSMLPLLRSPTARWRDEFLIQSKKLAGVPAFCGIRSYGYTYVMYVATGEQELYDLSSDPYEQSNVASDPRYARVVGRLHADEARLCRPRPPTGGGSGGGGE